MNYRVLVDLRPATAADRVVTRAAADEAGRSPSVEATSVSPDPYASYLGDTISADTVFHGVALVSLLGFACLLLAACFDGGLIA